MGDGPSHVGNRSWVRAWTFGMVVVVGGCAHQGASPEALPVAATSMASAEPDEPHEAAGEVVHVAVSRRSFPADLQGEPLLDGISYGPFREGQRPGGPGPSTAQLREDLGILSDRWQMIRVYSSRGPTPEILELIEEDGLPLKVMLGAWIAPDAAADNAAEVAEAIRLANAYPEVVIALSVGNESQVSWSAHRTPGTELIEHIRAVRGAVEQPVSTADDYNFWNKTESAPVAAEVDFLLLHAYAMWNQQPLDEAVSWTASTVQDIQAEHPDLTVVLGETGWATELNPEGDEVQWIKAPAGVEQQARFHRELTEWARGAGLPVFYFEAFDEPWKGSDDPREVEKHWGLYDSARVPKHDSDGGGR